MDSHREFYRASKDSYINNKMRDNKMVKKNINLEILTTPSKASNESSKDNGEKSKILVFEDRQEDLAPLKFIRNRLSINDLEHVISYDDE